MAGSSGELKNLKAEVSGLKEDVNQMKGLLEQLVKVSMKDGSEKLPKISLASSGTSKPAGDRTALPGAQSRKKTYKYEIDVLHFQQLVESSTEIPGLLKAAVNRDWKESFNILDKSLKINSPEYREFEEIKNELLYNMEDDFGYLDTCYNSIIAEASKYSLIHLIALFMKNGVSVNQSINDYKETMLHVAVEYGQYELVKLLLSLGATVNAKNLQLETALHLAARRNYPRIVELLLENGANIDAVNKHHETPLMVFHSLVQKSCKDKNTNEYAVAKIINKYDLDRWDKKKY